MKRVIYSLMLLLCTFFNSNAQSTILDRWLQKFGSERITFPVDGSVFQMNDNGIHNLNFAGQTSNSSTYVYRLLKKTGNGDDDWQVVQGYNEIIIANNITAPDNAKLFSHTINNLSKGWYKLIVSRKYSSLFFTLFDRYIQKSNVQFGVGDVYFVAGQSNASGWYFGSAPTLDNTISTTGESDKFSPMAKTINYNLNERFDASVIPALDKFRGIPYNSNVNILSKESPYFKDIVSKDIPTDKSQIEDQRSNIYPNGYNSWAYGPLSYKIATGGSGSNKFSGTPTLWFNCATGGTSINQYPNYYSWLNNVLDATSLTGKLDYTLLNFAGPFGAKAVLWHQGEYDHLGYLEAPTSRAAYATTYKNGLNNLITWTRESVDNSGAIGSKLNWFVSKASYTPFGDITAPSGSSKDVLVGNSEYVLGSGHKAWFSSDLKNIGQNININLPNIYEGPSTDELTGFIPGSMTETYRSSKYLIHFSGKDPLNALADSWYTKLYNTNNTSKSSVSIPATPLIPIQSITKSGNNYSITIANQGGTAKYYWTINSGAAITNLDIYPVSTPGISQSGSSATFSSYSPGDYLVGYVLKNGRLHPVQPFLVPGGAGQSKNIRVQYNNIVLPSSGGQARTGILAVGCDWEIVNQPQFFTVDYLSSTGELIFAASANNSGGNLSEFITLKEVGGSYYETIYITQASEVASVTTSLTTLSPSNSSSEWSGYGNANFNGTSIDGNTINIGGTQYNQGIGTHANSRIVYNLNNAYSTFSCKFGMDQESNCCDGASFTIKADGQTIYGPVNKSWGQAATVVSNLSVAGKSTLELVTDEIYTPYADHTDWAEVYLQSGNPVCTTPPTAPSNILANPSSISAGQTSTLSASCSYGQVVWSTGSTGNSITVNPQTTFSYTAKCVSVNCPESPLINVTVNVNPGGGGTCSAISNNLHMGTWSVTNHPLIARNFNNQWWLTQRIGTYPERFVVRGSQMLTRNDVSLTNSSYSGLISCFGFIYSNYEGIFPPNSVEFPTPSGFTLYYEPDGTPYYEANGGCSNPPSTPSNVVASPAAINSGQSSTLSATCTSGTIKWNTGQTTSSITVSPSSTAVYSVWCEQTGCSNSPSVSITVQVGPCASLSHNLVMGTWNVTGHQLVAKFYNNKWWLVQRFYSNGTEMFVVRGSEMLTRNDVTLTNGAYATMVGCFEYTYSGAGGLQPPSSAIFATPSGWIYGTEPPPDSTPFYTNNGGARISAETASSIQINSETKLSFVSIFPNPSEGKFNIKVYLENDSPLELDLINTSGKIYQSNKAAGKKGENIIPFEVKSPVSGNYMIRVKSDSKLQTVVVSIK